MTDEELIWQGRAPMANFGKPPRKVFVVQLEEARGRREGGGIPKTDVEPDPAMDPSNDITLRRRTQTERGQLVKNDPERPSRECTNRLQCNERRCEVFRICQGIALLNDLHSLTAWLLP